MVAVAKGLMSNKDPVSILKDLCKETTVPEPVVKYLKICSGKQCHKQARQFLSKFDVPIHIIVFAQLYQMTINHLAQLLHLL